jgi:hypothetical protein
VKETPGHIVINWCADIGIIDARDIDISRGENRASEEEELQENF